METYLRKVLLVEDGDSELEVTMKSAMVDIFASKFLKDREEFIFLN